MGPLWIPRHCDLSKKRVGEQTLLNRWQSKYWQVDLGDLNEFNIFYHVCKDRMYLKRPFKVIYKLDSKQWIRCSTSNMVMKNDLKNGIRCNLTTSKYLFIIFCGVAHMVKNPFAKTRNCKLKQADFSGNLFFVDSLTFA